MTQESGRGCSPPVPAPQPSRSADGTRTGGSHDPPSARRQPSANRSCSARPSSDRRQCRHRSRNRSTRPQRGRRPRPCRAAILTISNVRPRTSTHVAPPPSTLPIRPASTRSSLSCRARPPRAGHCRYQLLRATGRPGLHPSTSSDRRSSPATAARRPSRGRQGANRREPCCSWAAPTDVPASALVLSGRHHRRTARAHRQPRARARTGPGQPHRRRLRRHLPVRPAARRRPRTAPSRLRATLPIRRVVGPEDVAALAVHIMTNTAADRRDLRHRRWSAASSSVVRGRRGRILSRVGGRDAVVSGIRQCCGDGAQADSDPKVGPIRSGSTSPR